MSNPSGLAVWRCAIHVHTDYSDGAKSMEEVVREAAVAGVDALIVTDHSTTAAVAAGWEGRHGDVLVIVGAEVKTREQDHMLLIGTHERIATGILHTPDALHLLAQLGLTGFVAHPQGRPQKFFFSRKFKWRYWDSPGFCGVEVWSYMHDWIENCSPLKLPAMCREPDRYIDGPDPEILAKWDRLAVGRKVAGIGGLDTHGVYLPLGMGWLFGWAKNGILPYQQNFSAFATYTLAPDSPGDDRVAIRGVIDGLRTARSWICHDSLHPGRDARFYLQAPGRVHPVGSEVKFEQGLKLVIDLPVKARVRIVRDGERVLDETGSTLECAVQAPGVYRAEAYLDERFWILTNHVYIR